MKPTNSWLFHFLTGPQTFPSTISSQIYNCCNNNFIFPYPTSHKACQPWYTPVLPIQSTTRISSLLETSLCLLGSPDFTQYIQPGSEQRSSSHTLHPSPCSIPVAVAVQPAVWCTSPVCIYCGSNSGAGFQMST